MTSNSLPIGLARRTKIAIRQQRWSGKTSHYLRSNETHHQSGNSSGSDQQRRIPLESRHQQFTKKRRRYYALYFEPNTRYQHLLGLHEALRAIDEHAPSAPNYITRQFDESMEIPVDV